MTNSEEYVYRSLTGAGCTVQKNGHPDFLVRSSNGHFCYVEVKMIADCDNKSLVRGLNPDQVKMHSMLREAGIDVKVVYVAERGRDFVLLTEEQIYGDDQEFYTILNKVYDDLVADDRTLEHRAKRKDLKIVHREERWPTT